MYMISSAVEIFKFGGSTFLEAFKNPVKGRYTGKSGVHGNLCYSKTGIEQKLFCFLYSSLI